VRNFKEMRALLLIICISLIHLIGFGQGGNYKNFNPKTYEIGITKGYIDSIVLALVPLETEMKFKDSISTLLWDAYSNPLTFDQMHFQFSKMTLGNNGIQEKPFLAEWSAYKSDFDYFKMTFRFILREFNIIGYGDDLAGVEGAFSFMLRTKTIKIPPPDLLNGVYATDYYIKQINASISQIGLVALVTKDYYDVFVIPKNQKSDFIKLFMRVDWMIVEPME